jgi:hypothetical protein
MSWFKNRTVPEVKVQGNRFEIVPANAEIIDVEAESPNLPAKRGLSPTVESPAPRVGTIPQHSWGA